MENVPQCRANAARLQAAISFPARQGCVALGKGDRRPYRLLSICAARGLQVVQEPIHSCAVVDRYGLSIARVGRAGKDRPRWQVTNETRSDDQSRAPPALNTAERNAVGAERVARGACTASRGGHRITSKTLRAVNVFALSGIPGSEAARAALARAKSGFFPCHKRCHNNPDHLSYGRVKSLRLRENAPTSRI
jgi:hypothetical protein